MPQPRKSIIPQTSEDGTAEGVIVWDPQLQQERQPYPGELDYSFSKGDDPNAEQRRQNKLSRSLEQFTFMKLTPHERFLPNLNLETIARLTMLSTYLQFGTDVLMAKETTPMKKKDIRKVLGLKRSTFERFLSECGAIPRVNEYGVVIGNVDLDPNHRYIWKGEDNYWHLNQSAFFRGRMERKKSTFANKVYIENIRRLYNSVEQKAHRRLGVIFTLTPWINQQWNIICRNPLETDERLVEALSPREVGNLIGYHDHKTMTAFRAALKSIKLDFHGQEQYFCIFMENGDRTEIRVNPNFIYCGTQANKEKLLALKNMYVPKAS